MAPGFASYHVRSVSLPCRSHLLIDNLEEQIQLVRSWAANPENSHPLQYLIRESFTITRSEPFFLTWHESQSPKILPPIAIRIPNRLRFISNRKVRVILCNTGEDTDSNLEGSLAWIKAGLMQIELLHTALNEFLQLSQTQETHRQAVSVNQLLDLLQLVDFYGLFLSNIDTLKQCNSEVQSALWPQDRVQMASSLRSHRQVEKQMLARG